MSIPPILHNDNLIFDDIERANLFNIYFSKQSEIDDSNSNIPNLLHVTNQISEIKLCENIVKQGTLDYFCLPGHLRCFVNRRVKNKINM
jgi:hypothetical protein